MGWICLGFLAIGFIWGYFGRWATRSNFDLERRQGWPLGRHGRWY